MRIPAIAFSALAAFGATSAAASSLSLQDVAAIFCDGSVSGDMAAVEAILTAELAALAQAHPEVAWRSGAVQPDECMMVGASGTKDYPEIVVFSSYADGTPAYSDRIVATFVDGELRIDDLAFPDGSRLRDRLTP